MAEELDLFELVLRVTSDGIEKARKDLEGLSDAQKKQAGASKAQQQEIARSTQVLSQLTALVDKNDKAAIANLQKLTAAQKDWASQLGASTNQLLKIEAVEQRLSRLSNTADHTAGGVKKLGNVFEKLASDVLGVSPAASKVGTVLGEFALGGVVTVGVLGGLAAMTLAWKGAIETWRDAGKEGDELISNLAGQTKALRAAGEAAAQSALTFAKANLARVQSSQGGGFSTALGSAVGGLGFGAFIGTGEATKNALALQQALDAVAAAERNVGAAADEVREKKLASDRAMLAFNEGMAQIFKGIADRDKKAAEDAKRRLDERIKVLSDAMVFDDLRARASKELTAIENGLSRAIAAGNLPLERRVELEERLARVRAGLSISPTPLATSPTVGTTPQNESGAFGGSRGPLATIPESAIKKLPPIVNESGRVAVEAMTKLQSDMAAAIGTLGQTLADGIYNAFAAAFNGEGIGGVFKAFGKTVLAGIGQIFTMMGQAYLEYGIIMSGLVPTLSNPFTAGPTAIAIGALLTALGAALGAIGKGSGRGTASAGAFREPGGVTSDVIRLKFVDRPGSNSILNPRENVTFNIFGPNDPTAQRAIVDTLKNATRRGLGVA